MSEAERKVRPGRVAILGGLFLTFLVLVLCLGYLGIQFSIQSSRKATIQGLIDDADTALVEISEMTYPKQLNAESFALIQEAARNELNEYKSKLSGLLSDGVTEEEMTEAQNLEHPADAYLKVFENIEFYPQEVVDLFNQDNENLEFLLHYGSQEPYLEAQKTINLGDDYPKLSQSDLGWAYMPYKDTILGVDGSLPTCLSIVISHIKKDAEITPYVIAQKIESAYDQTNQTDEEAFYDLYGYLMEETDEGLKAMQLAAADYGLLIADLDVTKDGILLALNQNIAVICQIISANGIDWKAVEEDYIVLTHYYEDGTVDIIDPANPSRNSIKFPLEQLIENNILNARALYQ